MNDVGRGRSLPVARLVGVLAVVIAAALVLVLLQRDGDEGGAEVAAVPSASAPEPAAGKPVPDATEPTVRPYATGLSGRVHRPGPRPTDKATVEPGYDGCDHGYGAPGQCVPWDFPSSVRGAAAKCAWLEGAGFEPGLSVRGADRHRLDPDRDGLACES
ncbi:hypothetical protein [Actinocorallia longicatena]|uniref:Excalibur calcium-binding domain-containing protein n=1 Tax=Actinocorallia longicatena TaxID=111803 RepID=A0ABP6PV28_9ACTN